MEQRGIIEMLKNYDMNIALSKFDDVLAGRMELLNHFINGLSLDERDIIKLRYFRGYAIKDLAAKTGYSESGIKRRISKSIGKIVRMFELQKKLSQRVYIADQR